ncbi:hypothetical protein RJ641_023291 [Dillenia turbinata]|uniref:Uncharacterized protein n=1 Tax=Dillenia turbinata TaxID=194707 RepID=A0AAN8U6S7_9MAGN
MEIEVESDPDVEVLGLRRIEEAIHSIMARRSAPDWLPFIPGSSYWVPPRTRYSEVAKLVGKLASNQEEAKPFTSSRGWPSSSSFFKGGPLLHTEGEASSDMFQSEDEE